MEIDEAIVEARYMSDSQFWRDQMGDMAHDTLRTLLAHVDALEADKKRLDSGRIRIRGSGLFLELDLRAAIDAAMQCPASVRKETA